MVVLMLSRSPYPTTVMESDSDFSAVRTATLSTDANFAFAFNDSNFSDRLLRIKIMGDSPESRPDSEACTSIADWAHHRKRRREDFKDTAVVELTDCLEEQILNDNQPDMDDEPCENQDEDAIAMVEESPSGDYSNGKEGEGQSTQYKDMSSYYNDQRVQQPCHLSSSIYYGGQDIYHHTPSQENDSTYEKDGTDDDGTACRGNWWQGSLYY